MENIICDSNSDIFESFHISEDTAGTACSLGIAKEDFILCVTDTITILTLKYYPNEKRKVS